VNRPKPPTINDVAAKSGVSKRTVSRVINNSEKVNKATRERVKEVIAELKFEPNRQARGLAANRSYLLGLVYDIPTLFTSEIQNGVLGVCGEAGYELVVHACPATTEEPLDNITRFISRANLDGVIVLSPVSDISRLQQVLDAAGCNYVLFTSEPGNQPWKQVTTDYMPAISDMTRHLVEFGHRKMAFISGPASIISSQKRYEAFVHALASHDLALDQNMVAEGSFTYDSGISAARKLLTSKQRPTAIFAANDEMAFGVMHVAHELGLRIPDDLSVVGLDGTPFSTFTIPSLSTIIRQTDKISYLATCKLLALIEGGKEAASSMGTLVSLRFVPRESTGPVPASK
jgi:LacI family transcriptional regulator